MGKLKSILIQKPILSGFLLIFLYSILGVISFPAHFLFSDTSAGQLFGDGLSKFIMFLIMLLIIWRLDWLDKARFSKVGSIKTWIITLCISVYLIFGELFAFTGDFQPVLPTSDLFFASLLLSLSTGLVEETVFRGLLLLIMIEAWGKTQGGIIKAILLSSVFFATLHLANLGLRPWPIILTQTVLMFLPGVFYASFVFKTKSIWPVILIHGISNAAVNVKVISNATYQENYRMWLLFGMVLLPLIIYSIFIMKDIFDSSPVVSEDGVA